MKRILNRIETFLDEKTKLHAFLSGGGLRVIRVEREQQLIGYGEHPNVHDALRILAEDLEEGGRPYNEVYGKIELHYLTGSSMPEDCLDAWIRKGSTFDAYKKGDMFFCELHGYDQQETPKDISKRALEGSTERWTSDRGVVFETSAIRFANGEVGTSTRIVECPENISHHKAWMWEAVHKGRGITLASAIDNAFQVPFEEIKR